MRLAAVAAAAWVSAALLMSRSTHAAEATAAAGLVATVAAVRMRRRWALALAIGMLVGAATTAVHVAALHTGPGREARAEPATRRAAAATGA